MGWKGVDCGTLNHLIMSRVARCRRPSRTCACAHCSARRKDFHWCLALFPIAAKMKRLQTLSRIVFNCVFWQAFACAPVPMYCNQSCVCVSAQLLRVCVSACFYHTFPSTPGPGLFSPAQILSHTSLHNHYKRSWKIFANVLAVRAHCLIKMLPTSTETKRCQPAAEG